MANLIWRQYFTRCDYMVLKLNINLTFLIVFKYFDIFLACFDNFPVVRIFFADVAMFEYFIFSDFHWTFWEPLVFFLKVCRKGLQLLIIWCLTQIPTLAQNHPIFVLVRRVTLFYIGKTNFFFIFYTLATLEHKGCV